MKKISTQWLLLAAVLFILSTSTAYAGGAVVIIEPGTGSTVSSPVKDWLGPIVHWYECPLCGQTFGEFVSYY